MNKVSAALWVSSGAALMASATFGVVACSSNSTPIGSAVPGPDAAKADAGNVNAPDTSFVPTDGGGNPALDSGSACTTPPKLYPPSSKGIYCPYSKSGDAGSQYCTIGSEVCCLSPSSDAGASVCAANGSCPMGDSPWACSAPEECGGGQVCCLTAGPVEADPKCLGYQKTKGFNNTRCSSAQACVGTIDAGKYVDNQFMVCAKQADCATGTCTAIKTSGTSIGVCL